MEIPLLHDINGKQLLHDSTYSLMHDKNSSRIANEKKNINQLSIQNVTRPIYLSMQWVV